ncbi:MAG: TVP38/TMEM64 family protein [Lentisphaerota bacterium]
MRNIKRVWIPSLIVVLVIMLLLLLFRCLGITNFSRAQIDHVQEVIHSLGIWGYVLYIAISLLTCLALGPATPLVLVAGIFGVVVGTLLASFALTLSATCAFLLARYTFRPFMHKKLGHLKAFQKIDAGVARDGWHMLLITRLVPGIPFSLQNYLYGLTRIHLGIYILITWLTILAPCLAYVLIGGSLISGEGEIKKILLYVIVGGILLAALSFIPKYWIRKSRLKNDLPLAGG